MFPRDAEVRRVLKQYPDVTCAERRALWSWYRRAGPVELMTALADPSLEQPLERLRRDHPPAMCAGVMALPAIVVPLLLVLAAALI